MEQWEREASRCLSSNINISVLRKADHMQQAVLSLSSQTSGKAKTLFIIPAKQLAWWFKEAPGEGLFRMPLLAVYVDEVHDYRNAGEFTHAVSHLCGQAVVRLGLTATPLPTHLSNVLNELGILRVVGPEGECPLQLKPAVSASLKGITPGDAADASKEQIRVIRRLLTPSILRRTRESKDQKGNPLVKLPPLTEEPVEIDLTERQMEVVERESKSQHIQPVCFSHPRPSHCLTSSHVRVSTLPSAGHAFSS